MVPPAQMPATKNQAARKWAFLVMFSVLVAGCMPPGPRSMLDGRKLLDEGRYPQAVEKLKLATSLLKTNAQAWNYLGVACQHAGQLNEAATAYLTALKFDQNLAEARFNLGCLWLEHNRPDLAAEQFTTYTLQRGRAVEGFLKLGLAQYRLRQFTAAEQCFQRARQLSANNPEALNGLGLVLLQRNHPREAAQYFNAAVKQHPDYRPALLNLATVLHRYLHDTSDALKEYHEYLKLKPRAADWDTVNALAQELEREVSPPPRPAANVVAPHRAVVATHSAANTKPEKSPPAHPPAPLHTKPVINPVKKSSPPLPAPTVVKLSPEPVIKTEPGALPATAPVEPANTAPTPPVAVSSSPPAKRSFFRRLNPFRRKPKAEPRVTPLPTTGIEHSPTTEPANSSASAPETVSRYTYLTPASPPKGDRAAANRAFAQGEQLQRADRLQEAAAAYKQAAQLDPTYFEAQYNLGLVEYESRNYRRSLTAWENALAIRPDSIDARYNFALALKAANHPQDAANELEKILAKNPQEVRAHLELGNYYAQTLHDPAKARVQYLKVLELAPHDPQSTAIRYWLVAHPP
jgi:tetratricopeptide (TPR) repeat protein